MCAILLSINPQYVDRIMNGEKQYEFRKSLCKRKVDKIIIYSTSPIMKVVGEAEVENIIVDKPRTVWGKTKKYSGIERQFFEEYYKGRSQAVAYKLTHIIQYEEPKELIDYGIKNPPQSFCYLNM